ncbi:sorbosone dehydrogenase [Rhodospirillaceae bacterium KN72]|uniref:Sorbosone dehydrogenase n=1 Tax=Pacificispira spongiicola TaxID=2729598 RepID=A0A7Y0HCZ2_9PROT|nr:PQQ-dependent sugar dehydrogenase [Pacificispira spongiicola]NMM43236.1 sorbosone dehydrogenase [Pacificispira spongiicola]
MRDMSKTIRRLCAAALMSPILAVPSFAQDDRPGQVHFVDPTTLPAPYATPSVANSAERVRRGDAMPILADGFEATLYADGVTGARTLRVVPGNGLLVARSRSGAVMLLEDRDGDGRADSKRDILTGLSRPHGLVLQGGNLFVADQQTVYRTSWPLAGELTPLTSPGLFGSSGGHWTRNIAVSPDGRYLYASIGSRSNIGEEDAPRATIQRYEIMPDGSVGPGETFAAGLRNPVGIAFLPGTGRLFTVVNERDGMGDGLVPDYFTEVHQGAFYGWPYAYIGANPQPDYADRRPDLVQAGRVPDVLFQSHSAPLDLVFLQGANVPDAWRDDALVSLHGSWNSGTPTGYKVVRVEFENGGPTGRYIDFMTGFRVDNGAETAEVWGRPVGLAVGEDGAIYVGDDLGGTIWKIFHR